MAELRKGCEKLGFENVQTYIQSGNLTLSSEWPAAEIREKIVGFVTDACAFTPDILVMERGEFQKIVADCPYGDKGEDLSRVHVFFHLGTPPDTGDIALPEGDMSQFKAGISAHYLSTPDGMSKSKLAEILSRKLKEYATARNLRTCKKLLAMSG